MGLVLLSLVLYRSAVGELEEAAERRLHQVCDLVAAEAQQMFSLLVREVELCAASPLTIETALDYEDPARVEAFTRYFVRVRDEWGVFQSINLVNPGADCVATSNMEGDRLYHPEHKRMVSGRTDFKEAMAGKTAISKRMVSRGTGRPCMAVSVPIRGDNKIIAVLRAVVDLGFFNREYMASLRVGGVGRLLVLDPALEGRLTSPALNEPLARQSYVRPDVTIPEDRKASTSGLFRYKARDGLHMAAFRRLAPFQWVIVAEQPFSEILHPVGRFRNMAFGVTAALFLAMGMAIFLLTRPAMRALEQCHRFADAIAGDKPVVPLTVGRRDEIGLLAENLNKMAAALAQRQEERETAHQAREQVQETERLLAESRWQALRYQVNPHFLFNVLNSLDALARTAPQRIPELTGNLSDYLRLTLETPEGRRVPLGQELNAVKAYLAIEKVRYEEKLEIDFEIDPDAKSVKVPDLLLQPLLENAIKFGMHTSSLPLRVRVAASFSGDRLHIRVQNSGRWVESEDRTQNATLSGLGVRNLQRRLTMMYPNAYHLTIHKEDGRVTVEMELPAK